MLVNNRLVEKETHKFLSLELDSRDRTFIVGCLYFQKKKPKLSNKQVKILSEIFKKYAD